jgi:CheY-like chemotaxis protein
VLDVTIPKLDCYGLCQELRKQSDVPIVMLTALGQQHPVAPAALGVVAQGQQAATNRLQYQTRARFWVKPTFTVTTPVM